MTDPTPSWARTPAADPTPSWSRLVQTLGDPVDLCGIDPLDLCVDPVTTCAASFTKTPASNPSSSWTRLP